MGTSSMFAIPAPSASPAADPILADVLRTMKDIASQNAKIIAQNERLAGLLMNDPAKQFYSLEELCARWQMGRKKVMAELTERRVPYAGGGHGQRILVHASQVQKLDTLFVLEGRIDG